MVPNQDLIALTWGNLANLKSPQGNLGRVIILKVEKIHSKTKVITLNTNTCFFWKEALFVLSSSAYPNSATSYHWSKQTEIMRWVCESVVRCHHINGYGCVSKLDAPTKPVRYKWSTLGKPMKHIEPGEPLLLRHTHLHFDSLHLSHFGSKHCKYANTKSWKIHPANPTWWLQPAIFHGRFAILPFCWPKFSPCTVPEN